MFYIVLNLLALGFFTLGCEYLWLSKKIGAEDARKIMHIFGGVNAAFWPLYMSWDEIRLLIVISILAIVVLRFGKIAKSFFAVGRKSIGDLLGPLTIGVLAFISPPTVLFVLIVLHIALADGLAAVVGTRYGKSNAYSVLGHKKSVVGTLTFVATSMLIVLGVYIIGGFTGSVSVLAVYFIPLIVAGIENIGVYGLDNTLVAVAVGMLAKVFGFY